MFILRVHSVDTEQPIGSSEEIEFYATTSPSKPNPQISERRGVIHLYRKASQSSLPNPSSRSTCLFVVAVPNYLSAVDFIRFVGPHLDSIVHLLFIRNDGIEDRYSVIINLVDQSAADGFYRSLNGKRFSPAEAEFCHILFTHSVEYWESGEIASTPPVEDTELGEIASTPPVKFTELPTCPICLEAKSKRESLIADAVKAATSGMQDIQSELEQCTEEKNALAEINRDLIKNQKIWSNKVKEIEEREAAQLKAKDEIILDLEEQIRDIKVYIEAQKTLKDMTESDGIKGGTLLPVPLTQSSLANTKKHKKSGRRRN
ncbi:BRCA1-associated 2 [Corchorus olitorius]|uniref:BRCA1-associated 2 n=1 Tax=Corchorus olitorius TaxID=93759 RepID=A0A1R3GI41_9ROSI|nr:BRCA1-associated 2 [Corchorus olitorius]